ncbi:hypothetical protein L3Q82_006600 [Scortum barcoo]|uniref:Uncharacterized protein n=1 Tax=Scortum barcoo TaxID=214431 RepID=A0ACB8WZT0_9TELE|nr:hypothetical protein L3Q82_006600 [Scortum barcoo]
MLFGLACGTPGRKLTGTGRPKQAAARTVLEAKTRVWEEFGEAMEEDYRSASKRFWQTVRRLRKGKQYSANTVYSAGGELLTSDWGIVGRWKKYFEDLLNPTDLPSNEEAEAGVSEVDSSITQAEVTEVVRKLLAVARRLGVDEIHPEYLKSLDVVGLSWLTRLCNIAWRLGTVPLEWQTGVVVPLFKKGTGECVPTTGGSHFSASPGRSLYARVLERRIWPIVDNLGSQIQEKQCGFRPGRGTLDQLYTLHRVLEGLYGVCPTSPHVLCGSGEGIRLCPSWYSVGVLREYGVRGQALCCRSLVRIAGSQDLQHVLERFAAECEAAGMRISTSKSEAIVLDRKRVACPLRVGGEVLPSSGGVQVSRVLFTSEGKIDRRIGAASCMKLCGRCTGPSW